MKEGYGVFMRLEGKNIGFSYGKKVVLRNVSLRVDSGERVGLIAPSGYGKSTLARILAGYEKNYQGQVLLDGQSIGKGYNPVQLIYQHPEKAVNPRFRMRDVLEESGMLREDVLDRMGIQRGWLNRYPRELSGGELQRFCVARALGEQTRFLIADEISTMLDMITQAQIWQLLLREASERQLGLLIISHNMELLHKICTRVESLTELNKL